MKRAMKKAMENTTEIIMEESENFKLYQPVPRTEEEIKNLCSRLNRVRGQIEGIRCMLDDNRHCNDILIQISAVESALHALAYHVFEEYLTDCVAQRMGQDEDAIQETMKLIKRFL